MTRVDVALGERGYAVGIETGLLDCMGQQVLPLLARPHVFIVTDIGIAGAQLPRLLRSLDRQGLGYDVRIVPEGEASKSWTELGATVEWLVGAGCARTDLLIAFGGGVVGDLAGFAAAIAKRGCRYVQVPTSLLAQVDASVGGKTAVNLAGGKNMAGAFHQPVAVMIDPGALATLPPRHMRAGYAEVVKYGLIADPRFFAWCESHGAEVIAGDDAALLYAISYCVAAKARIVASDEHDTGGKRALLNLGHSFAHALETAAGLDDALLHGEAVAAGIALAFGYSARLNLCSEEDARRVAAHFEAAGLRTKLGDVGCVGSGAALVGLMMQDKKNTDGKLTLILARGIGEAFVQPGVDADDVARFLDERSL